MSAKAGLESEGEEFLSSLSERLNDTDSIAMTIHQFLESPLRLSFDPILAHESVAALRESGTGLKLWNKLQLFANGLVSDYFEFDCGKLSEKEMRKLRLLSLIRLVTRDLVSDWKLSDLAESLQCESIENLSSLIRDAIELKYIDAHLNTETQSLKINKIGMIFFHISQYDFILCCNLNTDYT